MFKNISFFFATKPYALAYTFFVLMAIAGCKDPLEKTSEQSIFSMNDTTSTIPLAETPAIKPNPEFAEKIPSDTVIKTPKELITETKDSIESAVTAYANELRTEMDSIMKKKIQEREAHIRKYGLGTPPPIQGTDSLKMKPVNPMDYTKCSCEQAVLVNKKTTLTSLANVSGQSIAYLKSINKPLVFVNEDKKKGELKAGMKFCLKRKKC